MRWRRHSRGSMPMRFAPLQRQAVLRTSPIQGECTSHATRGLTLILTRG